MLQELTKRANENEQANYTDTIEEEKYDVLKAFFEQTIEQDDFEKLKDGYVYLDEKNTVSL